MRDKKQGLPADDELQKSYTYLPIQKVINIDNQDIMIVGYKWGTISGQFGQIRE